MEQNAKKKIPCGGFMLGEGLVLSEDGKTLSVSGGGGGGSADAVLYTKQTLTEAQKKQARENVDAASDFVINATPNSDYTSATLDKTFAQIQEALNAGKTPVVLFGNTSYVTLVQKGPDFVLFGSGAVDDKNSYFVTLYVYPDTDPQLAVTSVLIPNSDGTMPQISVEADPTEPMEIATKKYVDDKECILQSTTPGSTKKFKITVDDSGAISATEVTA